MPDSAAQRAESHPHPLATAIAQENGHPHFTETGLSSSQPPTPFSSKWFSISLFPPHAHCPRGPSGVRPCEILLHPQTFLGTGVRSGSRHGPENACPFPFPPGGSGPCTCPSAPGSPGSQEALRPAEMAAPEAPGRTSLGPLPCCPHHLLASKPVILATLPHACPDPQYLAGSSGGQAGGHVTLWVSRALMSLSLSVCTSAPATVNADRRGDVRRAEKESGIPFGFTHRRKMPRTASSERNGAWPALCTGGVGWGLLMALSYVRGTGKSPSDPGL